VWDVGSPALGMRSSLAVSSEDRMRLSSPQASSYLTTEGWLNKSWPVARKDLDVCTVK